MANDTVHFIDKQQGCSSKYKIFIHEIKDVCCITVFLLSGYVEPPGRSLNRVRVEESCKKGCSSLVYKEHVYTDVLQYLQLADISNLDTTDKFAKVHPLLDLLNANCFANFIPKLNISIDESMVSCYG